MTNGKKEIKLCSNCSSDKKVSVYRKGPLLCNKCRERMRKNGHLEIIKRIKGNELLQHADYAEVIIFSKDIEYKVKIDLEDVEMIRKYTWVMTDNGYSKNSDGIRMHRMIHGIADNKLDVDHINRDKLDNRRNNLRTATRQNNSFNTGLKKNNTSGVTGVTYATRDGLWVAQIWDGNTKHAKCFKSKNDAIVFRLTKETGIYGEFAPQKHLFKQYGINV